jgi:hypothetical protein
MEPKGLEPTQNPREKHIDSASAAQSAALAADDLERASDWL